MLMQATYTLTSTDGRLRAPHSINLTHSYISTIQLVVTKTLEKHHSAQHGRPVHQNIPIRRDVRLTTSYL